MVVVVVVVKMALAGLGRRPWMRAGAGVFVILFVRSFVFGAVLLAAAGFKRRPLDKSRSGPDCYFIFLSGRLFWGRLLVVAALKTYSGQD